MRKKFKNFIEEHSLVPPKSKILLAVSGGVDSMVMLHLVKECGYNFLVAHCNFMLRGEESEGDEQLVREICKHYEVDLFVKRFETQAYADEKGFSIQVAARKLRYQWFDKLCQEYGFSAVAVAHNKNDIAETMLINLCRGTGLKGLTGIKPKTNGIIRPLLFAQRDEIEEYAKSNSITYRIDSSNIDVKYARNRIRNKVLPEFEIINEGIIDNLYSTSLFLTDTWKAIEAMNNDFRPKVRDLVDTEIHYSLALLVDYPFRQIFLVDELAKFGFPAAMVLDIEKSIFTQSGKNFYSQSHQLIRDREAFIVSPINVLKEIRDIWVEEGTTIINKPIEMTLEVLLPDENFEIPKSNTIAVLDYNKLQFPLLLRPWRNGDWFIPFGMKGRKKISDFLVDSKVSLHRKDSVYILESKGDIVWVVGFRIDNRYRLTDRSTKVLLVRT